MENREQPLFPPCGFPGSYSGHQVPLPSDDLAGMRRLNFVQERHALSLAPPKPRGTLGRTLLTWYLLANHTVASPK